MSETNRRTFLRWSAIMTAAAFAAPMLPAALANAATGTPPPLDSLTSDWIPQVELAHSPAVSNFYGGVNVAANVLGVENFTLPPYSQGSTCCELTVDSTALSTTSSRWSAYEILREATTAKGLTVQTATRLVFEANQLMLRVTVSNPTSAQVTTTLSVNLNPLIRKYTSGWDWTIPRPGDTNFTARTVGAPATNVMVSDNSSAAVTTFAVSSGATLAVSGASGTATWNLSLAAGAKQTLNIVMAVGDTSTGKALAQVSDGQTVINTANTILQSFTTYFGNAETNWSTRWTNAFTAGSKDYSGSLPVLTPSKTDNTSNAIARLYYMSILSVLCCERTNLGSNFNTLLGRSGSYSGFDRVYVTAAPEYAVTVSYFWDTSYCSVLLSLLDPTMVKSQTEYWLGLNIHNCYAVEWVGGGTVGPWYSANDLTVSSTILNYLNYSGDTGYLDTTVNNNSVLQLLYNSATYYQKLVPSGGNLADYGGASNLLEVLPNYTNQVASFNAANVWLMNQVATLYQNHKNDTTTATNLRNTASSLLPNVLDLYVAGQGVWNCRHSDGTLVTVRTVVDFAIASNLLADSLTSTQKTEMKKFVTTELLTGDWMRALSLSDSEAPVARPDHGTTGAYDTWPALTAQTFARFGDYTSFLNQLTTFSGVTSQGPFGQAHQLTGLTGPAVEDSPELNPSSALTLSAWINPSSWPSNVWQGSIIAKDTWSNGNAGYVLRGGAGGALQFAITIGGSWTTVQTTATVPTGGWHHVAAVYDGAHMLIYIDGVQQASQAQTGSLTPSTGVPVVVGDCPSDASRAFVGDIDEARVYSQALSASAIAAEYNSGVSGKPGTNPTPVMRLPFDEGSGEWTTEAITGVPTPINCATWTTGQSGFGNALAFTASSSSQAAVIAATVMTFNEVCGGKFADVIISDLFGYTPDGTTNTALRDATVNRGFSGTLSGLVFKGTSYTITSSSTGLSIASG